MPRWLKEYLLLVAISALIAGFFLSTFLSSKAFVGAGSDIGFLNYPMRNYFRYCLSHFTWPLWNPYMELGMPAQTGARPIYSPLVLATIWLPTALHLKVSIWLHITLSIGILACFLRSRGHSYAAGLCAGMVFGYSGFATGHLYAGHLDWMEVQPFYPLLTWISLNALRRPGPGWTILMALTLAMTVLSGHYQSVYLILFSLVTFQSLLAILGSAYAVPATSWADTWLCQEQPRAANPEPGILLTSGVSFRERRIDLWRTFLTWLSAGSLALALCSFQILPAAQSLLNSNRLTHSGAFSGHQPGLITWLTALMPNFFDGNRVFIFWSYWPAPEADMYLGVAALALIPMACTWSTRRGWIPLLLTFALAVCITPGPNSFLYRWLTHLDPVFLGNFRAASRFAQIDTFFAAWLVALGVDRLCQGRLWLALLCPGLPILGAAAWLGSFRSDPQAWADFVYAYCEQGNWDVLTNPQGEHYRLILDSAVASLWWTSKLLLAFLCLSFAPARWRRVGVVVLFAIDLKVLGLRYLTMADESVILIPSAIENSIRKEAGVQRCILDPKLHWLNRGMTHRLFELGGYDSMANPTYEKVVSKIEGFPPEVPLTILEPWKEHPLWSILGGSILVSAAEEPPWPGLTAIEASPRVYRNPRALPRAYMVATTEWTPDRTRAVQQLLADSWSLASTAQVNSPTPAPQGIKPIRYKIEDCRIEPNRITVIVENDQPGMLVVSDAWWPGWNLAVDGQPSTLYCLSAGLQRGAWLPAGHHRVVFWYWPRLLTYGILVSSGSLLLMIALMTRKRGDSPLS